MNTLNLSAGEALGLCLGYDKQIMLNGQIHLNEKYLVIMHKNEDADVSLISLSETYSALSSHYENDLPEQIIGWVEFDSATSLASDAGTKIYGVADYFLFIRPFAVDKTEQAGKETKGYKLKVALPMLEDDVLVITDEFGSEILHFNTYNYTDNYSFGFYCTEAQYMDLKEKGLLKIEKLRVKAQLCDLLFRCEPILVEGGISENESFVEVLYEEPNIYFVRFVTTGHPQYEYTAPDKGIYYDVDWGPMSYCKNEVSDRKDNAFDEGSDYVEGENDYMFTFETEFLCNKALVTFGGTILGPSECYKHRFSRILHYEENIKKILENLLEKQKLTEYKAIYDGKLSEGENINLFSIMDGEYIALKLFYEAEDGAMISVLISATQLEVSICCMKKMYVGQCRLEDINGMETTMLIECPEF